MLSLLSKFSSSEPHPHSSPFSSVQILSCCIVFWTEPSSIQRSVFPYCKFLKKISLYPFKEDLGLLLFDNKPLTVTMLITGFHLDLIGTLLKWNMIYKLYCRFCKNCFSFQDFFSSAQNFYHWYILNVSKYFIINVY